MGANLPKRAAIEAICRSFQVETEELLAEFRSEEKKRVSAQRFEMLASKIAYLKDEENRFSDKNLQSLRATLRLA